MRQYEAIVYKELVCKKCKKKTVTMIDDTKEYCGYCNGPVIKHYKSERKSV